MYNFRLRNWEIQASQVVLVVKNPLANETGIKDMGSIPESGRSPRGGHGNPLQYSYLENPMDREAWWATVHGVTRSQTHLKWLYTHTSKKPMPESTLFVVQSLSHVQRFATPWTAAHQVSLSIVSRTLLKFMFIQCVMTSNHLILCRPFLLLPSIFPSNRVFHESALRIRWPKYWSFSFSISPSLNIQDWFSLGLTGLISSKPSGLSRAFFNTTV